jgi:hypothetical protein
LPCDERSVHQDGVRCGSHVQGLSCYAVIPGRILVRTPAVS